MKRPVNQLAPADLPVPPGSREYLIQLGLRFVQMQVDAQARKSQQAVAQRPAHQQSEQEGAQS